MCRYCINVFGYTAREYLPGPRCYCRFAASFHGTAVTRANKLACLGYEVLLQNESALELQVALPRRLRCWGHWYDGRIQLIRKLQVATGHSTNESAAAAGQCMAPSTKSATYTG